jgi:hypothetical protein
LPDWIQNDEKVTEHMMAYDGTKSFYENEMDYIKWQFDNVTFNSKRLVHGRDTEERAPTFEVNAYYDPSTMTVIVQLGKCISLTIHFTYMSRNPALHLVRWV